MQSEKIATDTIVLISGASGVGKTTIARTLLQYVPELIIMQEVDLLREAIRTYSSTLKEKYDLNDMSLVSDLSIFMKSTSELSIQEIKIQTQMINGVIAGICKRLQAKKIPAVIEGVNISIERLFEDELTREYYLNAPNIYIFNLYIKDAHVHRQRMNRRAQLADSPIISEELFKNIRAYNDYLFNQTQKHIKQSQRLTDESQRKPLVFNIDVSIEKPDDIALRIVRCLASIKC